MQPFDAVKEVKNQTPVKTVFKSISAAGFFFLLLALPVFISGSGRSPFAERHSANKPFNNSAPATGIRSAKAIALSLYETMNLRAAGLSVTAFEYAWKGYHYLLEKGLLGRDSILSICDFSQSSRRKRLFIINMDAQKLILKTYVAHGRKSGGEYARSFSNSPESHKTSLGFYITRSAYRGDHGLALKIEGLERGFNDKAGRRNIVIHGSDYVGSDFLQNNRFSGRSFGCPAVPSDETETVIDNIKDGTCLFIYHPTKKYLVHSKILNG